MFTGIIEEVGTIKDVRQSGDEMVMVIQAKTVLQDVQLGDSISVNGVCLTVTEFTDQSFEVDVMPETVRATSLRGLSSGSKVNLERAMSANGRFGGHFVSGHVDGTGTILSKKKDHNAVYYRIGVSENLRKYMIEKGSVTVDGTSLTIFSVDEGSFTISIIPHTLDETTIGRKNVGNIVNIECDMVGKYIEHFISKRYLKEPSSSLTDSFLAEHGFK
ncbi:riboflavin synthase [Alkalihalobacillus hemicellulosilyticus]|uniref:Riboflavin synthase n=1 Tax=Halalkalibacter hemicellulosilyticusJCM 9152 TaxID=1236971 RepID=W4QA78_9BACI|nr:riboflavin synthase [Halalkalibacter hemicellulosilyticus]GAE28936.1 riboflavin synthase eubacterial/eukaryotic [Halalkalibacter hemicellulosilyticusJCM 9152]